MPNEGGPDKRLSMFTDFFKLNQSIEKNTLGNRTDNTVYI